MEILQHLDGVIDYAAFEVKYLSQFWEREAFKNIPKSMSLAAGIVDEGNYRVEPVKKIASVWPIGRAWSVRIACGCRRRAASAGIRPGTSRFSKTL